MKKYLKYLTGQYFRPSFLPDGGGATDTVVLVHGLMHRSWIMLSLAEFLSGCGYRVYVYDYMSTRKKIEAHGSDFRQWLAETVPESSGRLHIVAHSMGGLICRCALGSGCTVPRERRGALIYLAVPHGGSPAASRWLRRLPVISGLLVRPLAQLKYGACAGKNLPHPEGWHIGSVTGRFDSKVPPDSSAYPQGSTETAGCGHAFIMDHPEVRIWIKNFLKNGRFY